MDSNQYTIKLAGKIVPLKFYYRQTVELYQNFIQSFYEGNGAIGVSEKEKAIFEENDLGYVWNYRAESKCLAALISDSFMPYNRLVFHSVAFFWNGKAWLITAPSGTGKTTQYRNLKKLYGNRIQIICGDNPVLHFQDDGIIMVYPSPWNGKENYRGAVAAPLGGIVWLLQNRENNIKRLPPRDAVVPIFRGINTYSRTPELVHQMFRLEERMITTVPIWKFENTGTLTSSKMLMKCLAEYEKKENHNEL